MPFLEYLATARDDVVLHPLTGKDGKTLLELVIKNRKHLTTLDNRADSPYIFIQNEREARDHILQLSRTNACDLGIWKDDRLAGFVGMKKRKDGYFYLYYWVAEKYCRQGVATAAAQALVACYLTTLCATEIRATVLPTNAASRTVLARIGFSCYHTNPVWEYYRTQRAAG